MTPSGLSFLRGRLPHVSMVKTADTRQPYNFRVPWWSRVYCSDATGSHMTDVDGNDYVDCMIGSGSLLLGHKHPSLVSAAEAERKNGSMLLNPILAIEVAEGLQRMVPSAERVRLLNSGTEAVMTALRFARAFTGRSKIIKFYGHYHGMDDQVLTGIDFGRGRLGAGIPEEAVSQSVLVTFGDIDALTAALRADDIAAVLLDPSMHTGGLWGPTTEYLEALKNAATEAGALVIFDEVITGFRMAPGGAQEFYGVIPDLSVFAKALGAGEKIAAVVGRADVMAVCDPVSIGKRPYAFQSGTGSDATSGLAAAVAAMSTYQKLGRSGGYGALGELTSRLGDGLRTAFADHGITCQVNRLGSMIRLYLADTSVDYERASQLDSTTLSLFHLAMITEGMLTLPGSKDFFLSFAHDEGDVSKIVEAAHRVLERYDFA